MCKYLRVDMEDELGNWYEYCKLTKRKCVCWGNIRMCNYRQELNKTLKWYIRLLNWLKRR